MKRCWKTLSQLSLLGLIACAGPGPVEPVTQTHPLEQDALYALELKMPVEAAYALDAALEKYQSVDDLNGQWRVRYMKASIAFANDDLEEAATQADVLEDLARQLNTATVRYKTYLILGRSRNDNQYYRQALNVASSSLEKAIVRAYLGETAVAVKLLEDDSSFSPADRGFIYYQHALATGSPAYFHRSLDAYRLAEDSRGIADSLLSLARIEFGNDRVLEARGYARRAVRALESAGDEKRAKTVESWLSTL
jgi:tetratricopeptide (TPR) repeat protein